MASIILLVLFILYAEGSLCRQTRIVGRILAYTHSLAILISMNTHMVIFCTFQEMIIYAFGFLACLHCSNSTAGKFMFGVLILLVFYLYYSALACIGFDIIVIGYSILDNSATVFSWIMVMALGCCTCSKDKNYLVNKRDLQLSVTSVILMIIASL